MFPSACVLTTPSTDMKVVNYIYLNGHTIFSFMKNHHQIPIKPNRHYLPNWEILSEPDVIPDTTPSCSPLSVKTSQMGETSATVCIILHQIPPNKPNNEWKTGNCIWKVLIRSKMWSKFTEHPVKAMAINLWAQVLIRMNPHSLDL